MRSRRRPGATRWLILGALGLLCGWPSPQPVSAAEVIERVLADLDGRPLLLSEVELLERLRGIDRKAALEAAIDARLMYREAARLPQAVVNESEAAKACASLRERAGPAADGLNADDLCALAAREAAIVKYIDFRFSPQVRASGATPEEAEKQMNERIEEWVKDLRAGAEIRYNP
jgi:hypothetical protein